MNAGSNTLPEPSFGSQPPSPAVAVPIRPMYWSIRRELWENRSIYIAPLAAGAVMMLAFLVSLIGLPRSMRALAGTDPAHQAMVLARPYSHAAMLLILTAVLVGIFYSLDAQYGERRDRSILFWKSLPVSDRTTVLAKAIIPLAVLPLLVFVIVAVIQLSMLLISSAVLLVNGMDVAALWTRVPLLKMLLLLLYSLTALTLWHAPIYTWLLLISAWARRTTFLWAVLPPLAICVLEGMAFHTSYFASLLKYRLFGFAGVAFAADAHAGIPLDPHFIPLTLLTPGRFLASPGLWLGLLAASALLVAAIRLRRYRDPI